MFWTLGGNHVGKGAISGWLEVVGPNINHLKLWPFDGTLEEVAQSANLIIAETYPAEVYHQLGLSRHGWSKRKHGGRQQAAPLLEARIVQRDYELDRDFRDLIKDGFAASSAGEDQFDALVGLLGMLDVVEGYRPEGFPQQAEITEWEGWIFGQSSS